MLHCSEWERRGTLHLPPSLQQQEVAFQQEVAVETDFFFFGMMLFFGGMMKKCVSWSCCSYGGCEKCDGVKLHTAVFIRMR